MIPTRVRVSPGRPPPRSAVSLSLSLTPPRLPSTGSPRVTLDTTGSRLPVVLSRSPSHLVPVPPGSRGSSSVVTSRVTVSSSCLRPGRPIVSLGPDFHPSPLTFQSVLHGGGQSDVSLRRGVPLPCVVPGLPAVPGSVRWIQSDTPGSRLYRCSTVVRGSVFVGL